MKSNEFNHILAAIIILTLVFSFSSIINQSYSFIPWAFLISVIIIFVSISAKKLMAHHLDSDVEHEVWQWQRFGFKPKSKIKKPIPAGIIFPVFITIISLGSVFLTTLLTYETRALERRAAKRHGFYSFKEMTDTHNALIGSAGSIALIALSIITYFLPIAGIETFSKFAIYYVFWNLLPISKLDGTQIYFGSPTLYSVLATITLILTALALITI